MNLLFDIGATKMRIAVSKERDSFEVPIIVKTPKDFREAMILFREVSSDLAKGEKIEAVAGGVAGPLNRNKSTLYKMPQLPEWGENLEIKKEIEAAASATAYIENDASMGGLGETAYGIGKGYEIVVYMTISTGVGGTRIVNGKIDKSAFGFEPGWLIIDADKSMCPDCKIGGYLNQYASGKSIEWINKKKASEIKDEAFWNEKAKIISYGLNNITVLWSPDIIVIGGSVASAISIDKIREFSRDSIKVFPEIPKIERSVLGDEVGLYGALHYLKDVNHQKA